MKTKPDVIDQARWDELMALKKNDHIGQAFAILEDSVLHHLIERDGWRPDDECYMVRLEEARKLLEDHEAELIALARNLAWELGGMRYFRNAITYTPLKPSEAIGALNEVLKLRGEAVFQDMTAAAASL